MTQGGGQATETCEAVPASQGCGSGQRRVFAALAAADFSRGFQPTEDATPAPRRVSDA